jgi:membrane-associated protein
MTDLNLTDLFLNGLTTYGSMAFGLALLLGALGIPVPTTLLVVAAGALTRQGVIEWSAALGFGLLGVALGDSASYAIGRFAKDRIQRRFGQSSAWQTAQARFEQRGAQAVYLTRFLLTPLAIPTNLVAGSSGYIFRRFLTYDLAGELTWIALYGGLGYTFDSQWEVMTELVANYSSWLVGAVLVGIAVYFVNRLLQRVSRFHQVLRSAY